MNLQEARKGITEHIKDLIEDCPHCGARTHIEALWNDCHTFQNGDAEFYVVFRCKPCKKLILKTFCFKQNPYSRDTNLSIEGWDEMFPAKLDDLLSSEEKEYVPEEVLKDYEEALKCLSISAHRASCSMFRRALQCALLKLGADEKLDLVKQIESLQDLPKDIKDWSHQVRILGNWGAHPDKDGLKEVDGEVAAEVHDFIAKLLLYVFIMPQKVKLARERREQKSNSKKPVAGA